MTKPQRRDDASRNNEHSAGDTEAMMTAVWTRASARLRGELGEAVYGSWFGRLELDGVSGGVAQLSVPLVVDVGAGANWDVAH